MRAALLLALLTIACNTSTSSTTPAALPARGTPARIDLSATPGLNTAGGTATVNAKVSDAYATVLPDISVSFGTTAGNFAASPIMTDANGVARATLTAPPGNAQVTARAGSIEASPVLVAIQPLVQPPDATPTPPPSDPLPTPGPLAVVLTAQAVTLGSASVFTAAIDGGQPPWMLAWTFGDGASAEGISSSTAHAYAAIGSYTARVTVRDNSGRTASASTIASVTPYVPPPSPPPSPPPPSRYDVAIQISPTFPQVNVPVTVTVSVNGQFAPPPPASITINCGALANSSPPPSLSRTATCTYNRGGADTIQVTVTDGVALTSTASLTIIVH